MSGALDIVQCASCHGVGPFEECGYCRGTGRTTRRMNGWLLVWRRHPDYDPPPKHRREHERAMSRQRLTAELGSLERKP